MKHQPASHSAHYLRNYNFPRNSSDHPPISFHQIFIFSGEHSRARQILIIIQVNEWTLLCVVGNYGCPHQQNAESAEFSQLLWFLLSLREATKNFDRERVFSFSNYRKWYRRAASGVVFGASWWAEKVSSANIVNDVFAVKNYINCQHQCHYSEHTWWLIVFLGSLSVGAHLWVSTAVSMFLMQSKINLQAHKS